MEYGAFENGGTDDDLPPTYQIRGPRVLFSGGGRSSAGALSQAMIHSNLDTDIHQIEQQAYAGVIRAFKVQSDDLTWEKESMITELRRELKVTDEEHRVLLNKVNEEEAVHRIRNLRQGGITQSSLHLSSMVVHNVVPRKRQKKSHSIDPFPVNAFWSSMKDLQPVQQILAVKKFPAPEDIRWSSADQILSRQGVLQADHALEWHPNNNGVMLGAGRRRGRFLANEDYAPPDGYGMEDFSRIAVPNTGNMVKEVERVLSNPNMYEIEKAKKLLRDQEQSLLDAIARLDEESDGETEDIMPLEVRLSTTVG
ncbi:hypothetical protein ACP70R_001162 [Stipagrostis hirtigluma subsp. patula]